MDDDGRSAFDGKQTDEVAVRWLVLSQSSPSTCFSQWYMDSLIHQGHSSVEVLSLVIWRLWHWDNQIDITENKHTRATMVPLWVQCRSWKRQIVLISIGPSFEWPSCRQSGANHLFVQFGVSRRPTNIWCRHMQTSMIHNHQHGKEPIFQLDLSHGGLS